MPRLAIKRTVVTISVLLILLAACGKRKPPLPPVERVPQTVEITGKQTGSVVNLVWQMPARNAANGKTLNIRRADIYRLAEPLSSSLSLSEEEFSARSTLIASIPIADSDFGLKEKTYTDRLQFAGQQARLWYAVRFVNAAGQKAAFSNFFLIEPTAKIAKKPGSFRAEVTQDSIKLTWTAPAENENGSTPANILGYNVYRSDGDTPFEKLNDSPVNTNSYDDSFFEFDKEYSYYVRAASLGTGGLPVESAASETVSVATKDTFAPTPPGSITIAAAPNSISIFFATNLEKDVVEYRVYRTTNLSLPKSKWDLLTPKGLKTNTFQDAKVRSGTTYYYYLTAIDKAGNVSSPSEIVSETAF